MKNKRISISILIVMVLLVLSLAGTGLWMLAQKVIIPVDNSNLADIEWYNLNDEEFIITTTEELYGLAELSDFYNFSGQTIKLGADIVVNEGNAEDWNTKAPDKIWYPIKGFMGTFDGQGHTISGLYGTGVDTSIAMFVNPKQSCVIRDFKLINSYFSSKGTGGTASIASNGGGTFQKIYSDAIVVCEGEFCAGLISIVTAELVLEECWFDGEASVTDRTIGGLIDYSDYSKITINNCLNSGTINSAYKDGGGRVGGLVGALRKANLNICHTLNVGQVNPSNQYYAGSTIGAYYSGTTIESENIYTTLESYDVSIGRNGGQGKFTGQPYVLANNMLIGEGGYQWTALDFEKYWAINPDGTPILRCFAEEIPDVSGLAKGFDTSWYNESESEFVITTREQLYGLYYLSIGTDFEGKTIKLGANIVINEGKASKWAKKAPDFNWNPIKVFAGTIDGQGHTISGIYIKTKQELVGFIERTTLTSVVKNLRLTNSYYENSTDLTALMGSIVGRGNGVFDTIYSNAIIVSTGKQNGGIAAASNQNGVTTFRNCWFDGSITLKGDNAIYAGGIVSNVVMGNVTVEHCLNTADIQFEAKGKGIFIGGITGVTMNDGTTLTIKDSLNVGKIIGPYDVCVGSIIGRHNVGTNLNIKDTYAIKNSFIHPTKGFLGIGTNSSGENNGNAVGYDESYLTGFSAYEWTTLDFKNYWAVSTESTPILKSFASKVPSLAGRERKVDTSWYKSENKEYILDSRKDLFGFYILSETTDFADKTVKLGADIIVNDGNATTWGQQAPVDSWIPINKFAGNFDGQGHSISGLYIKSENTQIGLFEEFTNDATVKNTRLLNSYFEYTGDAQAIIGSIAGLGRGNLDTIYSDAIIVSSGIYSGGLVGSCGGKNPTKISNCWFNGSVTSNQQYVGGITGVSIMGPVTLENVLNTGMLTSTYGKKDDNIVFVGGLVGYHGGNGGTLRISDCLNIGVVTVYAEKGIKKDATGSIVGRARKPIEFKNTYTTNEINVVGGGSVATQSTVSGVGNYSTNANKITGKPQIRAMISLLGEMAHDLHLNFNADGKWVARIDETPVLKSFMMSGAVIPAKEQIVANTEWYTKNPSATEYELSSAADLYGLVELSESNTFAGKIIKLKNDIKVNDGDAKSWGTTSPQYRWHAITEFAGTFDGQGHCIEGLYMKTGTAKSGLFGKLTKAAKVKNLVIKNSYFEYLNNGEAYIGSLAGVCEGSVNTIYSNAIVVSNGSNTGGLIGHVTGASNHVIRNCWFDGTVTSDQINVGGLVGLISAVTKPNEVSISDCLNTGTVTSNYDIVDSSKNLMPFAGGFVGYYGSSAMLNVSDSLDVGSVTVTADEGTIVGTVGAMIGRGRTPITFNGGVYTTDSVVIIGKGKLNTASSVTGVGNYSTNGNTVVGKPKKVTTEKILGELAFYNTTLNFEKNGKWIARTETIPGLKSFVSGGVSITLREMLEANTEWYTKNPDATEFELSEAADLYGLAKLCETYTFEGKVIKLKNSIKVNDGDANSWGTTAPQYRWEAIPEFAGTFDGQGFSIEGLYMKTGVQMAGLFGVLTEEAKVSNLSIKNSYFEYLNDGEANIGSVVGYCKGSLDTVYSNAIVISTGSVTGGLIGQITGANNHVLKNCWFDGTVTSDQQYLGGLVGMIREVSSPHKVTVIDCLNTGSVTSNYKTTDASGNLLPYVGGFVGYYGSSAMLNVSDSLNVGSVTVTADKGVTVGGVGAMIGRGRTPITFNGGVYTSDVIEILGEGTLNMASSVNGVGNYTTTGNTVVGSAKTVTIESITGSKALYNTNLDFSETGSWITRKEAVPGLKGFVEDKDKDVLNAVIEPDTAWYDANPDARVFYISNAAELYGLVQVSRMDNFGGDVVKLTHDITVNRGNARDWETTTATNSWSSISSESRYFNGSFDGQGYTISGLYSKSTSRTTGLFSITTYNAKIKDFRLTNSYFEYEGTGLQARIGSIAGTGFGEFDTIYSDAIVKSCGIITGGLIGYLPGASKDQKIQNCWFDGEVISSAHDNTWGAAVGGLVGLVGVDANNNEKSLSIIDCLNSGKVENTYQYSGNQSLLGIGGFVGYCSQMKELIVTDCLDTGSVTVHGKDGAVLNGTGSVIGRSRSKVSFTDTYTTKNVIVEGSGSVNYSSTVNGVGNYSTNGNTINDAAVTVLLENLKAEGAKTEAPNLDYANKWKTVTDNYPIPKCFID